MTRQCEDQELLKEFLAEATELLAKVDDELISLEKASGDEELLNSVFRSIHTIKGAASFLEFEMLVKVTHATEEVLNKLRKRELALAPAIMDIILEAVDMVKTLVNDIKEEQVMERPIAGAIARLEALLEKREGISLPCRPPAAEDASNGAPQPAPKPIPPLPCEPRPAVESPAPANYSPAPPTWREELADKATVRVDVKRIDELMNQVGELVLERNRMTQLHRDYQGETNMAVFGEEFAKLTKRMNFVTSELQAQVLKMRLVPVGNVFRKFPRLIRAMARDLGKEVDLRVCGEDTELDRSVVDEIGDPLVHLLRNALDHGLETPEERLAAGKPQTGTIVLAARHEGNRIIISISDDGRGIDADRVAAKALEKGLIGPEQLAGIGRQEIFDLIFLPGFSTKEIASDFSGRGVGMDVVRTNIRKLNGLIEIKSEPGAGSEFVIKLPLTLAIIQALLVDVEGETYSIPLTAVVETIRVKDEEFRTIGGRRVLQLRDSVLPLLNLADTFAVPPQERRRKFRYVVVVGSAEKRLGLVVTRLLGQQEVAIKSMGTYLADVPGIAGSTIMGDGRVALIVDPARVVDMAAERTTAELGPATI